MKDFDDLPLGVNGQPALHTQAVAAGSADDFFGAGDALVLVVGPEDLSGGDGRGLPARVAALVDGDLDDLGPPDPQAEDPDPERSRRTYVYPWAGARRRLVAVALAADQGAGALRVQGDKVARELKKTCRRVGVVLGAGWAADPRGISAFIEGACYGNFEWKKYKSRQSSRGLEQLSLLVDGTPPAAIEAAVARGTAIGQSAVLARGLTLEPPERLYPQSLAQRALEIALELDSVRCEVWSEERIRSERLNGMLAVGRGSSQPVAQIEYVYEPPGGAERTVVLVGKGVTYDSGGLQAKGPHMNHMNRDMAGASAVVAMMQALDALKPPVKVIGLAGAAENMSGPNAYKTDEIIVHRDGKTTSVGHTDAEGRLVLYDQLVYAREAYDPDLVIDMATLTGAVRMALGTDTFAVISNKQGVEAREQLLGAARAAGEKAWPLPLSHDLPNSVHVVKNYEKNFGEVMKGKESDLDNDGDREFGAGTCKGGAFLAEAIDEQVPWLHLDVAFTAMDGPMGSPVPTLCHLLDDLD
jgi:leucyl aminopeptidase